uniref:Uncharacterized protein n=1 Tax=Triticum urartu TaxID=4572 RepID=A0A8R7VEY9_TRIUA
MCLLKLILINIPMLIRNCRGCHGRSQGRGSRRRRCRSPHRKYTFLGWRRYLASIPKIQQSCISLSSSPVSFSAASEREDAAVGEGAPEPDRAGAHHLHRRRDGLLHRRRQDHPLHGQKALLRGRAGPPQEHLLQLIRL